MRSQDATKGGAYFIYVDRDEVPFFKDFFDRNIPRVELSAERDFKNAVMRDGMVVDKLSSKASTIFGFENIRIEGDQAEAEVLEYTGPLSITLHTYKLVLQDRKWMVTEHLQKPVS